MFAYKRRAVDIRSLGRELGAKYVLEGSVRRSGKRIRVSAQLIEAAAEVVAMQGRLKYLGVQEPSLEAIYTRYFEAKPEQGAQERTRHAA